MKICTLCNANEKEKRIINGKNGLLCSTCYQRERVNCIKQEIPKFGEIKFNGEGKPICHLCGKAYNKVLTHVYQIHGLNEKEYKKKFGLELYNGIMSEHSKEIAKKRALENANIVVKKNLIERGKATRFEANHTGRTIDKVSERTRKRLILNRFPNCYSNKRENNP